MRERDIKNQDSPCVSICRFNDDDVCIGCGRTVKEVHEAYLESIGYCETTKTATTTTTESNLYETTTTSKF